MDLRLLAYCELEEPPAAEKFLSIVFSDTVPPEFRQRKHKTEFPMSLDVLETFLRAHGYWHCDYAFPDPAAALPLRTLGVRGQAPRPVRAAQLWGINLMNYLQAPALFSLLAQAGVPALRRERGEHDPLIVLGGHIWGNPLPLADFYDVLVVGDGEEVLLRIAQVLEAHAGSRAGLLAVLAELEGVYVPGYTRHLVRRAVIDYQSPVYPAGSSILRDGAAGVVLSRGCPYSCAFCSSSVVGGPYRCKPAAQLRAQLLRLRQAGAQTIIPIAANATAYQSDDQSVLDLFDFIMALGMNIKYMSDRPERFGPRYLRLLAQSTGKTILAVESGPALRGQVFQKTLTEDNIQRAVRDSIAAGINRVQLYAILATPPISAGVVDFLPQGHPGEQPADLRYLAQLAAEIARQMAQAGLARQPGRPYVVLDCMPFIPAIGTRLQRVAFSQYATYSARIAELRALLPPDVAEWVEVQPALDEAVHLLQAFLERADARAGLALWQAWQTDAALPLALLQQVVRRSGLAADLFEEFLDRDLPYAGLIEVSNGGVGGSTAG